MRRLVNFMSLWPTASPHGLIWFVWSKESFCSISRVSTEYQRSVIIVYINWVQVSTVLDFCQERSFPCGAISSLHIDWPIWTAGKGYAYAEKVPDLQLLRSISLQEACASSENAYSTLWKYSIIWKKSRQKTDAQGVFEEQSQKVTCLHQWQGQQKLGRNWRSSRNTRLVFVNCLYVSSSRA